MFRIKICGITNVNDARVAAAAGADAIGLNFFSKSRRFVEPATAAEFVRALPAHVTKVGVFVNHEAQQIAAILQQVPLDFVQLHGDEPPAVLAELPGSVQIVSAHRCSGDKLDRVKEYLDECRALGRVPQAVLLDADAGAEFGGTGRVADWPHIAARRAALGAVPLVLAGGLTPENVAAAIAAVRPDGVDVASGVERSAGSKDPRLVERFIAAARAAFDEIGQ